RRIGRRPTASVSETGNRLSANATVKRLHGIAITGKSIAPSGGKAIKNAETDAGKSVRDAAAASKRFDASARNGARMAASSSRNPATGESYGMAIAPSSATTIPIVFGAAPRTSTSNGAMVNG